MKEIEMDLTGFKNEIGEHISQLTEETSILKSQMKA
jgi:hypothetical protein